MNMLPQKSNILILTLVSVYSHFVFLILRVISFVLSNENEDGESALSRSTVEGVRSLLLSLDVFVAASIYFFPKMYGLFKHDDDYFKAVMAIQRRQSVTPGSVSRSSFHGSVMGYGTPAYNSSFSNYNRGSFSRLELDENGNASSDRYSGVDTFEPARKRRSTRISQSTGADIGCDVEGNSNGKLAGVKKMDSARSFFSSEGNDSQGNDSKSIDIKLEREEAENGRGRGWASMESTSGDKSQLSADNIGPSKGNRSFVDEDKDSPKEACPIRSCGSQGSQSNSGARLAFANLEDEVATRNPEAESVGQSERRQSQEILTDEMFIDYIHNWKDNNVNAICNSEEGGPRKKNASEIAQEIALQVESSFSDVSQMSYESQSGKSRRMGGIDDHALTADQLQIQGLYGDDKKLGDKHYFF